MRKAVDRKTGKSPTKRATSVSAFAQTLRKAEDVISRYRGTLCALASG